MKKLLITTFLLLFFSSIHSTPQIGDLLIYKGDTVSVYPLILEKYISGRSDNSIIREKIKDIIIPSTACWHGYRTLYEIRNDSLFLIKAYGKRNINLSAIFGKEGNIFIDWYTGTLTSPRNMLMYDHNNWWGGYYEYETDFRIEGGILKSVREYHNYVRPTIYTNQDTLMNFIKSNIDYNNVKATGQKVRVLTRIDDVDNNGKITKVSVVKGHDGYNEEAVRVIKSIPQWQVIIRRGEKEHIYWSVPVLFDEKN